MRNTCLSSRAPARGARATIGTLILAAASAAVTVPMSGCHSAPANNAFASTPAQKATEARLKPRETMPPLQPFDEHFVEVPQDDE